jgi:hypothetical protein
MSLRSHQFFSSDFNFDIEEIYIKTISTKEWFSEVLKRSKRKRLKDCIN